MTVPGLAWIADRVDGVNLVRGGSPALTAVLAFVLAGYRIGTAADPGVHGAAAAVVG